LIGRRAQAARQRLRPDLISDRDIAIMAMLPPAAKRWRLDIFTAAYRKIDIKSGNTAPMSAPQSNLSSWTIGQQHHPIRSGSPAIWSFRQGQPTRSPATFAQFDHS
jgi:hypothetical protein